MSTGNRFFWLMGGLTAILIIASVAGWLLERRVKGDTERAVVENLNARVHAWWVLIVIFAVAYLIGKVATIVLFAVVSFFALREFLTPTPTRAGDRRAMSVAFFVLIPVQYYLIGIGWYALCTIFIPVYEGQNARLVFYLLLVVQMSDVLQYVFGKLFGKTKLAPVVSPSKTVEGLVGGAAGATLIGTGMWWIMPFPPCKLRRWRLSPCSWAFSAAWCSPRSNAVWGQRIGAR